MFRTIVAAICLWAVAGLGLSTLFSTPGSARILGHRAVYDLKLIKAKEGADITAVDGRMALELADACDGHTLHQRIVLRIYDTRGGVVTSDFRMTSWEAADGRSFRFNTREEVNGREIHAYDGIANLKASSGNSGNSGGTVTMTKGQDGSQDLIKGTLFPTAHTKQLIAHAKVGDKLLIVDIFDGSKGLGSRFGTSAFIGGPLAPDSYKAEHEGAEILSAVASWPVQVAYFPYIKSSDGGDVRAELPEFEIGYRIFDNGIISDLKVDYGDFEVSGTLNKLETLPDPGC